MHWLPLMALATPVKFPQRTEMTFSKTALSHNVLVMSRIKESKTEPSWTDVLVVGEFCQDESEMHQAGLLQL